MTETSKNNTFKRSKKNVLLNLILDDFKAGLNSKKIIENHNISKQRLSYYVGKLKREGLIKNIGYGTWEVQQVKNYSLSTLEKRSKNIRGHAFIWKVQLKKKYNWKNDLKIPYDLVGKEGYPRIIINNKKVWLGKKNIIIFDVGSYYAERPIESRKYAVISLIETLQAIENKLGINLRPYTFKPSREHYGLVKNDLAIQCNREGEKIYVKDDLEGLWLWIDNSFNLNELETGGQKALVRGTQVQKWFNDNKKHNFEVTPTYILESLNRLTEDRQYWAKHQISHVKAIQDLSKGVRDLRAEVKNMGSAFRKEERKRGKKKEEKQTTLF